MAVSTKHHVCMMGMGHTHYLGDFSTTSWTIKSALVLPPLCLALMAKYNFSPCCPIQYLQVHILDGLCVLLPFRPLRLDLCDRFLSSIRLPIPYPARISAISAFSSSGTSTPMAHNIASETFAGALPVLPTPNNLGLTPFLFFVLGVPDPNSLFIVFTRASRHVDQDVIVCR